jgi:hypothetical protein
MTSGALKICSYGSWVSRGSSLGNPEHPASPARQKEVRNNNVNAKGEAIDGGIVL